MIVFKPIGWQLLGVRFPCWVFNQVRSHAIENAGSNCIRNVLCKEIAGIWRLVSGCIEDDT